MLALSIKSPCAATGAFAAGESSTAARGASSLASMASSRRLGQAKHDQHGECSGRLRAKSPSTSMTIDIVLHGRSSLDKRRRFRQLAGRDRRDD
jgi:hypothetical protein